MGMHGARRFIKSSIFCIEVEILGSRNERQKNEETLLATRVVRNFEILILFSFAPRKLDFPDFLTDWELFVRLYGYLTLVGPFSYKINLIRYKMMRSSCKFKSEEFFTWMNILKNNTKVFIILSLIVKFLR